MFSRTKAQQAPMLGRAAVARQASRSVPLHTASTSRKRTSGGTSQTNSSATSTVITALNGVPKRLTRIQPIQPLDANGGGWLGAGAAHEHLRVFRVPTAAMSAIAQRSRSAMREL